MGERGEIAYPARQIQQRAVDLVGANTRAGRRQEETARFFEFLVGEIPGVLERWRSEARSG